MPPETNPADDELMRLAIGEDDDTSPASEADDKAPKEQQSPDPDEGADDEPDNPEGGEEEAEKAKPRSKPLERRLAEVTAKLRQRERELEELRSTYSSEPAEKPEAPNPDDYALGDLDPEYNNARTKWLVETALSERDAEREKVRETQTEQTEIGERIQTAISDVEKAGKEKYEDFEDRVTQALEARSGEPLPQPLAIALSISPVGADLTYRLATDEGAAEKLEQLAGSSMNAMALALGELEGEYIEDDGDADLDVTDELDMARMLGRMRARLKGPKPETKPEVRVTKAPEPPQSRVRGGSGRFEVSDDTDDFAAFEARIMGGKK